MNSGRHAGATTDPGAPGSLQRLVGFDAGGEAFLSDGRVLRGIYAGHGSTYREVLDTCERADLFRFGIIATGALAGNPFPSLGYDMVLEHERVPFVTYPHEWSAPMLKAAALFHLDLFERLSEHDLTLKDWHPYNILFRGTEPVFVDFTSIIRIDHLQKESYLAAGSSAAQARGWDATASYVYEMYRRMYIPYFLMPLYMMAQGRHETARRRMLATTLNAATSTITPGEVFAGRPVRRLSYELRERQKRRAIRVRDTGQGRFFGMLRAELEALDVTVPESGYSSYYAAKNEQVGYEPSADWSAKQVAVYDTLQQFRPSTLLDVGSNTGWFSVLAARHGASVVALDIDEASIDILYGKAHAEKLSVLPLVMNVAEATPNVAAHTYPDEPCLSLIGGDTPLLRSASARLACETVLALALVHHLALGRGIPVNEIAAMLSGYATRALVVEFVALDDPLIVAEPTFFPAYCKNPSAFAAYTLDSFITALSVFFSSVEVRKSNPETRTLLLCSK